MNLLLDLLIKENKKPVKSKLVVLSFTGNLKMSYRSDQTTDANVQHIF